MKRTRFLSALMALAMILSLCTFASATTPTHYAALGAGTDSEGHMTVGQLGDTTGATETVPASFAGATIAYTAAYTAAVAANGSTPASPATLVVTLANTIADANGSAIANATATIETGKTLDLLKTDPVVIKVSDGTATGIWNLTVTPDGKSPKANINSATITLGAAGAFKPDDLDNDVNGGQLNQSFQDTIIGTVRNEDDAPAATINLTIPTLATTKHAFDLYLDPHDLIKNTASGSERYKTVSGGAYTVSGGKRLYFKTSNTAMTNESQELTITNKSSCKVSVGLSIEATKPNGSNFKFVATEAEADAASEPATAVPAIYLALVAGSDTKVVSDTADADGKNVAKLNASIDTDPTWYNLEWHGAEDLGYYSYEMKTGSHTFKDLKFKLRGAINDATGWDDINTFGLSVVWDIQEFKELAPTATVSPAFSGAGTTLSIALTWGTGSKAKTKATLTIPGITDPVTVTDAVDTLTCTAPTGASGYSKVQNPATLVFYNTDPTDSDAVTVNLTVK